ncbi:unnamed protein product [Mytilus edulis]|uniref:Uncharacterized protein n=1 Tax=Mytilus edulis TaxID=6550 RepID=A0A8S3S939_MYTED|nr:unnamed protein product [Mytilus edulis]
MGRQNIRFINVKRICKRKWCNACLVWPAHKTKRSTNTAAASTQARPSSDDKSTQIHIVQESKDIKTQTSSSTCSRTSQAVPSSFDKTTQTAEPTKSVSDYIVDIPDPVLLQSPKKEKVDSKNTNQFAESRNFIQTIADVSLMMANISQLRAVLGIGEHNQFYVSLISLIVLSLVSHSLFVFFTVLRSHFKNRHRMTINFKNEINRESNHKNGKTDGKKVKTIVGTNGTGVVYSGTGIVDNGTGSVNSETGVVDNGTGVVENGNGVVNNETGVGSNGNNTESNEKTVTYCFCLKKKASPQHYSDTDLCTCPHCHTDLYLSYACYFLVFITIVSNIGITGIGIS